MANQVDVIREACDFWYYETQKCRVDTTKQTKSSSDAAVGNNNDAVENQDEAATTATATVIEGPISTRALSKLYHVDKLISGATRVYRNSSSLAAVAGGATAGDCGDGGGTATNNNNGGSNDNQSTQQQQQHKHEGWKEIHQLDNLQMAMEAFREVVEMPSSWLVNDNHAEVGADALTTSAGGDAGGDASQNASNNMSRSGVNHGADNNVEQMTFDGDDIATNNNDVRSNNNNADDDDDVLQQQQQQEQTVADELEAFLSSTDHLAPHAANTTSTGADDDDDQEEYESDGGTRYIRDCQSGNWIHEALMMQQQQQQRRGNNGVTNGSRNSGGGGDQRAVQSNISNIEATTATTTTSTATKKRKRKKPKFSAKSARNWIYVTGLPLDTTEEELSKYFSKVGIIDIDPESLKPKIKLYRHKQPQQQQGQTSLGEEEEVGQLKGDASICYARPESVELALQILDENLFRDGAILSVQRAKFEQHGSTLFDTTDKSGGKGGGGGGKRRIISESKRRVARLAAIQAVGWDESENGRIAGGLKGLRIIVLMNMFDPRELEHDDDDDEENNNDTRLRTLEREIHTECEEIGTVEKITIFSKHPAGVVIVKFVKPNDASDAVNAFNGKVRGNGRKVEASFWDGTTDYTVVNVAKEERETEKRLDKFGDWLEEQELLEEFQLRVENED